MTSPLDTNRVSSEYVCNHRETCDKGYGVSNAKQHSGSKELEASGVGEEEHPEQRRYRYERSHQVGGLYGRLRRLQS